MDRWGLYDENLENGAAFLLLEWVVRLVGWSGDKKIASLVLFTVLEESEIIQIIFRMNIGYDNLLFGDLRYLLPLDRSLSTQLLGGSLDVLHLRSFLELNQESDKQIRQSATSTLGWKISRRSEVVGGKEEDEV
ncbi:hypothetical protein GCK72_024929 [Caenorhabditis remanei]|uniref:Uncharacterized protein n=1 Tax=Caenorhabditis remanei TaxID=31234 RepID=A0A6A5G1C5_CAERE|nr:hypothetical protein GCK72_024929 [Caenorhabditis remanei]KAF1748462.1 hypothetical protein GCK72_024929 [Caenorhabditis remanei]